MGKLTDIQMNQNVELMITLVLVSLSFQIGNQT